MRPGDHLDADDLADPAGGGGPGVDRRLDRGHVARHEGRHQAAADLVPTHEVHIGGLDIASLASTSATNPLVSIMPSASIDAEAMKALLLRLIPVESRHPLR